MSTQLREPEGSEFQSVYDGVNRNRGMGAIPAVMFYPPNKGDMVIVRFTTPLTKILGWQPGQKVDLLISKSGRKARVVTHDKQEKGWAPRKAKGKGDSQELHLQIKTTTKGVFIPKEKQVVTEYREVEPGVIEFDLPPNGEISEGR